MLHATRKRKGRWVAATVAVLMASLGLVAAAAGPASATPTSVEGNCLGYRSAANPGVSPLAVDNGDGTATISWTDECSNMINNGNTDAHYNIEASTDGGVTWTVIAGPIYTDRTVGSPGQNGNVIVGPIDPCLSYVFRVVAVVHAGQGPPKESISLNSNTLPVTGTSCGGGGGTGTCTQLTGAFTLGYYSNKNGQATITPADLAFLNGLVLVDYSGTDLTWASNKAFGNWLLNATAKNMSYMISAQLATLELNIRHNPVGWADKTVCEDALGRTIQQIADDAEAFVAANHVVLGSSAVRADGDAIETLLDEINNNLVSVQ